MTAEQFWQLTLVFFGLLAVIQFAKVLLRAKRRGGAWYQLVTWLLVLGVCAYATVLWGGQMFGLWTITPVLGRQTTALLLMVVVWLGILVQPTQ